MTCFVDASAIVAILGAEERWEVLADRIEGEGDPLWSGMSRWEGTVALRTRLKRSLGQVRAMVDTFAAENGFRLVAIGGREAALALDAFERYGMGTGHPAQLNMGDCFAYACARTNNARLIYKGDDFTHTDMAWPEPA